jgi:hypothetical protein
MNSKPVYSSDGKHRIAYVANGRWQLQYDTRVSSKEVDHWQPSMRPTTFNEARSALLAVEKKAA